MKRSQINAALRELETMCEKHHCYLPPFCHFTPQEWAEKGHEYDEIRDCCLGWDITDYGLGNFDKFGFSLITIRNGNRNMPEKYPKVYAEKLLYLKEGQYAPNHFHWFKTEDIINRGGGNVLIRVYNSHPDESIDYESDVTVHTDGRTCVVPAGTQIRLTPGESIHIQQYLYHDFSVEEGTGAVLLGEVSQCNDDNNDNRFQPPVGRFPTIEEDEAPYRLLCNEYPEAKKMREISVSELKLNPCEKIGKEWMLLTAGTEGSYNTMTCSWGHLGCLWNLPTSVCYVRPQRYTKEFMDREERYTLCFFPEQYRKALGYLGSHSGRDGDKVAEAGLTPVFGEGYTYFAEASLVLVCRKLFRQTLTEDAFLDKAVMEKNYPQKDFHDLYIGHIEKVLVSE